MKMSLDHLDAEIRELQNRIAAERLALEDAVNGCTDSLRDAVTSPKTLLALLGVGYGLGKLMFSGGKSTPQPAAPAKKAGILGAITGLAGAALSLTQPRFGVGTLVRWAASRAFASRERPAAPGPRVRTTAAPPPPTPRTSASAPGAAL
jgi:hypothetical protein